MHPGFPFHHDMRLRAGGPDFGGRISPGGMPHEFMHEWPQEYAMGYGPPPPGFRQGFCEAPDQEQIAMMERMGLPAHMARHNGFYRGPPFPQEPGYPHSPILHPEHQFQGQTISPATLSPGHHASYPSPDPAHQPPTPAAREPLMSPHHINQNGGPGAQVFFSGATACVMTGAPDSPAPGSSSSSGSILERALAKQEPSSPHAHMPHLEPTPPTHHPQDWPHVSQGFADVNVDEYIKHDFGMEGMVEYQGYAGHAGPPQQPVDEHHQYNHHTPVSVPPWVR